MQNGHCQTPLPCLDLELLCLHLYPHTTPVSRALSPQPLSSLSLSRSLALSLARSLSPASSPPLPPALTPHAH